jgi:ABC-type Fe3+/spermidine/putrescine transport system ATPase subunit
VDRLARAFDGRPAVDDVSLSLRAGEFFSLLGPSGCGKTTLLRLIGGYLAPDQGRVFLNGTDITQQPLEHRNIGMVFQTYALFPHLSAHANVAFGLEMRGVPRAEAARRVDAMLDRVGLSPAERTRRPRALSGGQQQRVALARALVFEPPLLLLDEPLANLDRQLREQLRADLKDIQRRTGVTTLFVTHDQDEALSLADRVGLMLGGKLLQIDTPQNLYERPRTPFVARFVGHANLFEVIEADATRLQLDGGMSLPAAGVGPLAKGGWIMIRPEKLVLGAGATSCPRTWTGEVASVTFLGADQLARINITPGLALIVRCRPDAAQDLRPGASVTVGIPSAAIWAIPEADPTWVGTVHAAH